MSSLSDMLTECDSEFRLLIAQTLKQNVEGAAPQTKAFLDAMGQLEQRLRNEAPAEETAEGLRADIERKRALHQKYTAAIQGWKNDLSGAIDKGQSVLENPVEEHS